MARRCGPPFLRIRPRPPIQTTGRWVGLVADPGPARSLFGQRFSLPIATGWQQLRQRGGAFSWARSPPCAVPQEPLNRNGRWMSALGLVSNPSASRAGNLILAAPRWPRGCFRPRPCGPGLVSAHGRTSCSTARRPACATCSAQLGPHQPPARSFSRSELAPRNSGALWSWGTAAC